MGSRRLGCASSRSRAIRGLSKNSKISWVCTYAYKRNGTTTLFAALTILDGKVIAQRQQRHRHTEWDMVGSESARILGVITAGSGRARFELLGLPDSH